MPTVTLAPAVEPVTTCLGCGRVIPAGRVWCSWPCRNLDDRHDDYEPEAVDD